MIGEATFEKLVQLDASGNGDSEAVEIDSEQFDKDARKRVHELVRTVFAKVETTTAPTAQGEGDCWLMSKCFRCRARYHQSFHPLLRCDHDQGCSQPDGREFILFSESFPGLDLTVSSFLRNTRDRRAGD